MWSDDKTMASRDGPFHRRSSPANRLEGVGVCHGCTTVSARENREFRPKNRESLAAHSGDDRAKPSFLGVVQFGADTVALSATGCEPLIAVTHF